MTLSKTMGTSSILTTERLTFRVFNMLYIEMLDLIYNNNKLKNVLLHKLHRRNKHLVASKSETDLDGGRFHLGILALPPLLLLW